MAAISRDKLKLVRRWYYTGQKSAPRIAEKLGVSVWVVYKFMKRHGLPRRTFSEENALRFERKSPSFQIKRTLTNRERELRALGVALYWGEGYKGGYGIDFANSNPEMIKLFLKFLRRICGINEKRLRILLYCYANQNVRKLSRFWSKLASVPAKQFSKPYVRKDFKIDKKEKMPFGLVHIRYSDKKLLLLIKKWVCDYIEKYAQVDP